MVRQRYEEETIKMNIIYDKKMIIMRRIKTVTMRIRRRVLR